MSQQYSDDDYTAVQRSPDDPFNTAEICPECGSKGWLIMNEGQPFAPLGEVQACDCGKLAGDEAATEAAVRAGYVVGSFNKVEEAPSLGPFPAEPVLRCPEAVAQAARTIGKADPDTPVRFAVGGYQRFLTRAQLEERRRAAVGAGDKAEEAFYAARLEGRLLAEGPLDAERPATLATASPWSVEVAVEAFARLERNQKDCAFANLLGALAVRFKFPEHNRASLQDLAEAALRAGGEVMP